MKRNIRKRCPKGFVEQLPVEVIGDILSRVAVARDVVRASLTSCNWRHAYHKHLHTLSFDVADDTRIYCQLPTADLEVLITRTLLQTSGLRKLSILMHNKHKFSVGSVVAWLFSVQGTLLELYYKVNTSPSINVFYVFGGKKLQTLGLYDSTIKEVEPNLQRFPQLTSLSLSRACTSVEDLNLLLMAFPKLECLELSAPIIQSAHDEVIKLHGSTFKSLILNKFEKSKFILEICGIEYVDVNDCLFGSFKIIGTKSLRHFKFFKSEVHLLDIEEGDNLEVLEFTACYVCRSNLFPMKIHTPKLKTFRIWGFSEQPEVSFGIDMEIISGRPNLAVDFDEIAARSPQLRHLSLFCDEGSCGYTWGWSSLENVVVLEIGCDYFEGFWEWGEKVVKCCPNVRKVIVHGMIREHQNEEFCEQLDEFKSSMDEVMSKYHHIEVQVVYTPRSHFRDYYSSSDW